MIRAGANYWRWINQEAVVRILVWIGRSRIASQGLFTAQDIPQGTRGIAYSGEQIAKDDSRKRLTRGNASIFTFNTRWAIDGKPRSNTARYINSCDSDCTVYITTRTMWIVAGRDITAGEELPYNDGYELDGSVPDMDVGGCSLYVLGVDMLKARSAPPPKGFGNSLQDDLLYHEGVRREGGAHDRDRRVSQWGFRSPSHHHAAGCGGQRRVAGRGPSKLSTGARQPGTAGYPG
jgi:uncharacterized protein